MRRKHLRVSVPWPSIVLSPNARVHWAKKRTEVQKARNYAYWETCSRAHGERAVQDTYSNESGTTEAKITADLSRIDILCLDDVAADPTTFESKLLTRILDARYRNDRPTLIVTETAAGSLRIHSDGGMRHSSIPESAPAQGTLISQPCAKVLP